MSESLGEAYPKAQERCRNLLVEYEKLGPAGVFGAAMIRQVLERADRAAVAGDITAMILAFQEMNNCE